jgi:hypothetical protein
MTYLAMKLATFPFYVWRDNTRDHVNSSEANAIDQVDDQLIYSEDLGANVYADAFQVLFGPVGRSNGYFCSTSPFILRV